MTCARLTALCMLGVSPALMEISAGEPWKLSLDANLTMTLNVYSDDWTGGEAGALSWASRLEAIAQKQVGKYLQTKNTLKLAFGQTKTQRDDDSWTAPQKSTDLIDLETRWKSTLGGWVDPYVSVRGVSQFIDLSDTTAPRYYPYVNPIDITESIGALRELVQKDEVAWTLRLGGALRQNINRWEPDEDYATMVTNDGGVEIVTDFEAELHDGFLKYKAGLKVYEALFRADSDEIPDHWRYPDINWENTLTVNITKYVMVSYYLQLLYDKEVSANARVKHALAFGLTYGGKYPGPQTKANKSLSE